MSLEKTYLNGMLEFMEENPWWFKTLNSFECLHFLILLEYAKAMKLNPDCYIPKNFGLSYVNLTYNPGWTA
jgi:hypothetical protein